MQLDKTAEECKRVHEERHKIYEQLVDIVKMQEEKKKGLEMIGKALGTITVDLKQREDEKRNKKEALSSQEKTNKAKEAENEGKGRIEDTERKKLKKAEEDIQNLEDITKSLKTELSARAMTLTQQRAEATMLSQKLDQQKERLLRTRSLLDNTRMQLSKHADTEANLESRRKRGSR